MKKVGFVKSYRSNNGCGFIHDVGGDVFVHVSNIQDNDGDPSDILLPGEQVEFEIFDSRRGKAAKRVRRLNPPVLPERSGKVSRVFSERGYGFIESAGDDVFFHYADTLFEGVQAGDSVLYLHAWISGRPRAFRVRRHNG